jgi:CRISPR-associated protein Cas1
MKENLYVFSDSLVKRKQNTLFFERLLDERSEELDLIREEYLFDNKIIMPSGEKKFMPVENIESIVTVGSVHFNSQLLYFLSRNKIPMHIITFRGSWAGSFYPSEGASSAPTLLAQAEAYKDADKRLKIVQALVNAAAHNTLLNLNYYRNRGRNLSETVSVIQELKNEIPYAEDIDELFGIEGYIKHNYYEGWREIFNYPVDFRARKRNPAPDFINAMISFGNAILYSIVTDMIYQSRLYPELGYMHSPGENKFSLTYDVADIYKPLIVDRTIFKVINKNMLSEKDFFKKRGYCLMKKETKKIFVAELEERILKKQTVEGFTKRINFKRIIKEDLYKLIKFINGETKAIKFYEAKW